MFRKIKEAFHYLTYSYKVIIAWNLGSLTVFPEFNNYPEILNIRVFYYFLGQGHPILSVSLTTRL